MQDKNEKKNKCETIAVRVCVYSAVSVGRERERGKTVTN